MTVNDSLGKSNRVQLTSPLFPELKGPPPGIYPYGPSRAALWTGPSKGHRPPWQFPRRCIEPACGRFARFLRR